MYYTYVLRSNEDSKLYTGFTNDIRKRFRQHNNNEAISTKGRGPLN